MQTFAWVWRSPPNWPPPPPGWTPPQGWAPPSDWAPAPENWQFWVQVPAASSVPPPPGLPPPPPGTPPPPPGMPPPPVYGQRWPNPAPVEVKIDPATRRSLVWETRFVMAAFLVPSIGAALVPLIQSTEGVSNISRFPTFVQSDPLLNMILGMVTYIGIGAVVPVALFLLVRTGNTPKSIGLGVPKFVMDIWPGLGLAALSYVSEIAILLPFSPLLHNSQTFTNSPTIGSVPHYYVIYGIFVSAVTAITEEVLVNGYLLVRLEQMGWTNRSALILSLILRMSYHIYYGAAFILVLPFGYFVTRSFQKHKRLNRSIAAHFIYDAVLFTISILV